MKQHGYVNSVVEPGAVLEEALSFAAVIAENGPLAVKAAREIALTSMTENWNDAEAWEKQLPIVAAVE